MRCIFIHVHIKQTISINPPKTPINPHPPFPSSNIYNHVPCEMIFFCLRLVLENRELLHRFFLYSRLI